MGLRGTFDSKSQVCQCTCQVDPRSVKHHTKPQTLAAQALHTQEFLEPRRPPMCARHCDGSKLGVHPSLVYCYCYCCCYYYYYYYYHGGYSHSHGCGRILLLPGLWLLLLLLLPLPTTATTMTTTTTATPLATCLLRIRNHSAIMETRKALKCCDGFRYGIITGFVAVLLLLLSMNDCRTPTF